VGYVNGMIVMRKRTPPTAQQVCDLIACGKKLPELTPANEAEVNDAIQTVRRRRRA
jgi:hypothetical protein